MGELGRGRNWGKAGSGEYGRGWGVAGSQGRYLREPCVKWRGCDIFLFEDKGKAEALIVLKKKVEPRRSGTLEKDERIKDWNWEGRGTEVSII